MLSKHNKIFDSDNVRISIYVMLLYVRKDADLNESLFSEFLLTFYNLQS